MAGSTIMKRTATSPAGVFPMWASPYKITQSLLVQSLIKLKRWRSSRLRTRRSFVQKQTTFVKSFTIPTQIY